jgi:hypothetical protein
LGAFYFAMADDNVRLDPVPQIPASKRVGVTRSAGAEMPTLETWRKARTAAYGQSEPKMTDKEKGVEEEIINGVIMRHYN